MTWISYLRSFLKHSLCSLSDLGRLGIQGQDAREYCRCVLYEALSRLESIRDSKGSVPHTMLWMLVVLAGQVVTVPMFYLSLIEHMLRMPPHILDLPLQDAIKSELENLFVDKVIAKLGLCISVYDIRNIKGGFIYPGDGASTYTVEFRLVMFRPFEGEIISGKLKGADATGLQLSLGFFDDIYVPDYLLPNPSKFVPDPLSGNRLRWTWEYGEEKLTIDESDEIRFKVNKVSYPPMPNEQPEDPIPNKQPEDSKPFAPMVITGSLDFDGLGPIAWWQQAQEVGDNMDEDAGEDAVS